MTSRVLPSSLVTYALRNPEQHDHIRETPARSSAAGTHAGVEPIQEPRGGEAECGQPRRVGQRSQETGVGDHDSPGRSRLHRLAVPTSLLVEEHSLEVPELASILESELGPSESVERLGKRFPAQRPGRRPYEGALAGAGGPLDRDDPGPIAWRHPVKTVGSSTKHSLFPNGSFR
jgi:hypothetical protein